MFICVSETITTEGITCEHCDQTVEEALEDGDGVTTASGRGQQ